MNTDHERLVTALRATMKENVRLREALDGGSTSEPIAVVGTGCRLSGSVDTPEQLWELASEGCETIGPLPDDRGWDLDALTGADGGEPRSIMDQGYFLDAPFDFDPAFFGISPREAEAMDPQQRVLLELAWESVERAGIAPTSLAGTETGVYVGAITQDYGPPISEAPSDGFAMTGVMTSVASGRISYTLGLTGPALTVETACSSSLVAVHLAVQALRAGECSLALAGGATVLARPGIFTEFTNLRGLAPDGRCKAFGAAADGTSFSEGAGLVVLERLSDALRNGRRILAVIRGGAVNQDGASNGLTAPNGPSQVKVIRRALADAEVEASGVDLVEAHGTGTTLGDPIEAQALLATYGRERPEDRPLWLGSLKSNVGHSQAAAGVVGLIKVVEALRHGVMPPTLHADEPTSHVDWDGSVRLLHDSRAWPETGRQRRAAVSSFGVSGTNAHMIVEQAPEPATQDGPEPEADTTVPGRAAEITGWRTEERQGPVAWPLSARDSSALAEQAARLRDRVEADPVLDPVDVGWSLATTRSALEHRAVVVGDSHDARLAALGTLEQGKPSPAVVTGRARADRRPVLVFPGQGGQWEGMAVELLDSSAEFAEHIAACERALAPHVEWRLTAVLRGEKEAPSLEHVDVVQPVLWAVMVSLARLWLSHGLRPAAVVGHSQGEIAAAYVAGALSLEDAAKVVALRSRAVLELAGTGAMASVAQPVEAVRERIAPWNGRVHVAVVNSPDSTVIAGETEAVTRLVEDYQATDVQARLIPVDYASHTPQVEPLRERVATDLAGIAPKPSEIPVYSTLTGQPLDGRLLNPEYWFEGLSGTVRFRQATEALLADGHDVFVEVGPHPVLTMAVQETADTFTADQGTAVLGTLRRDEGGPARFLTSVAEAYTHGVDIDWRRVLGDGGSVVALPTYAFQRQRYWRPGLGAGSGAAGHKDSGDSPDDWSYREDWVPAAAGSPVPVERGTWVIFGSDTEDTAVAECTAALEARGHSVHAVPMPESVDRDAVAALAGKAQAGAGPVTGVLSISALAKAAAAPPSARSAHRDVVHLFQGLGDAGIDAPLWCVTRGAVTAGGDVTDPGAALVWGLGRVAAQEHTDRWGGLVDLPPETEPEAGQVLTAILTGETAPGEDQVAVRRGSAFVRRLVHEPFGRTRALRRWEPSGTVLVTGGTGGLSAHTARWLARRGAEHLLLLSRRGADAPGSQELVAELRDSGAEVTLAACDVGDREALAEVLDGVPDRFPVRAVVHTAAALDDGAIDALTPDQVASALRAKADGALHLHELTRDLDLSAFVLYSSVSAVFGVSGQGNYAPGNAFCEALAHHRRSLGLPATSIAWGAWSGDGMAEQEAVAGLLSRHGMQTMAPEAALAALQRVLDRDPAAVAVADIEWQRFRTAFTASRPSPLIGDLGATGQTAAADSGAGDLDALLAGLTRPERGRALTELVCDHVAAILGYPSGDMVDAERGLKDLGMDSVTAVELRNRLSKRTGLRLSSTVAFDHPNCTALARHIEDRLFGDTENLVLSRLDGLEAALTEYQHEHGESGAGNGAVSERLRGLLRRLSPNDPALGGMNPDLEAADTEKLFAFIDDTLRD